MTESQQSDLNNKVFTSLINANRHQVESIIKSHLDSLMAVEEKLLFLNDLEETMTGFNNPMPDEINPFYDNAELLDKIFEVIYPCREKLVRTDTTLAGISNKFSFTDQQLILILYVVFKTVDIDISNAAHFNQTTLARLFHILTDSSFTKVQNSKFYSLIRQAPNFKGRKQQTLIDDLEIIKPYFERNNFQEGLLIINKLIYQAKEI
jgi:hypothetical protein